MHEAITESGAITVAVSSAEVHCNSSLVEDLVPLGKAPTLYH